MASANEHTPPTGRAGLALFRLGGVEVRLDYTWILIFLLVLVSLAVGYFPGAYPDLGRAEYWTASAVATLLFFGSILLHELSHAWMARRSGIPVPSITLFLFGGVSHMAREPDEPATDFRVAAVGPLMSFALAGAFWAAHAVLAPGAPELVAGVIAYLAWINAALGVFNLLPGLPLDGGRILRAVAWWKTGSLRRGTRVAANAGKGIAVGLMLLGGLQIFAGSLVGGLWLILIGLFLRGTAEAGYQSLVILQSLEDARVSDVAIRNPVCVSPQLPLSRLVEDHFLKHGFRAYPVVEGQALLGLVSIDSLQGVDEAERPHQTVKDRMRPLSPEMQVSPDTPLSEALEQLGQAPAGRLLVVRNGELVGLLSKEALVRFVEIRNVLRGDR